MSRVVLYTACFGEHDKPVDIPRGAFGPEVDVVCFTDSPKIAEALPGWTVFRRRSVFKTARMDAKWYKMSATHLFPDHDYSIYVDSSVRFHETEGFVDHAIRALGHNYEWPLAFFRHPEDPARTLRQEAEFSLTMGKYSGEPLIEQVAHYYNAGYKDRELLAGGCIVRQHGSWQHEGPVATLFEKAWFDECIHWSAQDQLSLPFVLDQQGVDYGVLPGSIYENEFFSRVWSGPDR